MREFLGAIHAPSTSAGLASKLTTISRAVGAYGYEPWPLSVVKIRALGAVLKRGGYASAAQYLSAYSTTAERDHGATISGPERRTHH